MKRTWFLLAVCSACCFTAIRAQSPAGKYFFLGVEMPILRIKDKGQSPQTFGGSATRFSMGYEEITPNFVSRVKISAVMGELSLKVKPKPKEKPKTTVDLSHFEVGYTYYGNTNAANNIVDNNYVLQGNYVGGTATIVIHMNAFSLPTNNVLSYNAGITLSGGGMMRSRLESIAPSRWRMNAEASLPLLSIIARPTYLGMVPVPEEKVEFGAKAILKKVKIMPIGLYSGLNFSIQAEEQIKDYRARRYSYDWRLLHNSGGARPYTLVGGGFGYQSLFKL